MIVHRIVDAVDDQHLAAVFLEEILVAHAPLDVRGIGGVFELALRLDVPFLEKAVDAADALGIHEVRRIPAAGGVEDDIEWAFVGRGLSLGSPGPRPRKTERHRQAQARGAAQLQEVATVHDRPHSYKKSSCRSR